MVMKNKKGWVRIVEAVIAVMIVFASVLIVMSKNKTDAGNGECEVSAQYLDEVAKNETLRYAVIKNDTAVLNNFFEIKIDDPSIKPVYSICNPEDSCLQPDSVPQNIEVCANERIISGARGAPDDPAKKIKLFLYRRS